MGPASTMLRSVQRAFSRATKFAARGVIVHLTVLSLLLGSIGWSQTAFVATVDKATAGEKESAAGSCCAARKSLLGTACCCATKGTGKTCGCKHAPVLASEESRDDQRETKSQKSNAVELCLTCPCDKQPSAGIVISVQPKLTATARTTFRQARGTRHVAVVSLLTSGSALRPETPPPRANG